MKSQVFPDRNAISSPYSEQYLHEFPDTNALQKPSLIKHPMEFNINVIQPNIDGQP